MSGLVRLLIVITGIAALLFKARSKITADAAAELAGWDTGVSGELGRFVELLNTASDESDPTYVAALQRLRERNVEVIADAERLDAQIPKTLYSLRQSIVMAVAALRDPAALSFLSRVALNPQPLPPKERLAFDPHFTEDAIQLTMLALTAIEGIEKLADDGHAPALDVLVEAVRIPSNSVRGAALTALAAADQRRDHLRRALRYLPADQQYLAQLQRIDVRDVPQIRDPRAHLAATEQRVAKAPHLPDHHGLQVEPLPPDRRFPPLIRRNRSNG